MVVLSDALVYIIPTVRAQFLSVSRSLSYAVCAIFQENGSDLGVSYPGPIMVGMFVPVPREVRANRPFLVPWVFVCLLRLGTRACLLNCIPAGLRVNCCVQAKPAAAQATPVAQAAAPAAQTQQVLLPLLLKMALGGGGTHSVCLSVYLSLSLFICLSLSISLPLSLSISLCLSFVTLSSFSLTPLSLSVSSPPLILSAFSRLFLALSQPIPLVPATRSAASASPTPAYSAAGVPPR